MFEKLMHSVNQPTKQPIRSLRLSQSHHLTIFGVWGAGDSGHYRVRSPDKEDPCGGGQLHRVCSEPGVLPLHPGCLHAGGPGPRPLHD